MLAPRFDFDERMTTTVSIDRDFVVNAPIERVWKITAEDFANVGSWASQIPNSTAHAGEAIAGAPASGRTCAVAVPGFSKIDEALTAYDPAERTFSYEVLSGLPSFVTKASNRWRLIELGPDQTRLELRGTLETRGLLGRLMAPMLKLNLIRAAKIIESDLRHIAEKGIPSPAKQKQLARAQG